MPKAAKTRPSAIHSTPVSNYRPSASWSPDDDEILLRAHAKGMTWKPIAQKYFPEKSGNACRKRHERLVDRLNAQAWDGVKLEKLATEYMRSRKDIWQPLADAVGEKWQFVEAKCMEKGLSSLSSAARSAARRSGGILGMEDHFDEDHDSGIAMEDEAEMEAGRRQSGRNAAASRNSGRNVAPAASVSPSMQQPLSYYPYQQSHLQLPPPVSPTTYTRAPAPLEPSSTRSVSYGPTIASLLSPAEPPAVYT